MLNPTTGARLKTPGISAHHDAIEQEEQREAMVPLHQCKVWSPSEGLHGARQHPMQNPQEE